MPSYHLSTELSEEALVEFIRKIRKSIHIENFHLAIRNIHPKNLDMNMTELKGRVFGLYGFMESTNQVRIFTPFSNREISPFKDTEEMSGDFYFLESMSLISGIPSDLHVWAHFRFEKNPAESVIRISIYEKDKTEPFFHILFDSKALRITIDMERKYTKFRPRFKKSILGWVPDSAMKLLMLRG